jgi:hypothetical protein
MLELAKIASDQLTSIRVKNIDCLCQLLKTPLFVSE